MSRNEKEFETACEMFKSMLSESPMHERAAKEIVQERKIKKVQKVAVKAQM